jgi:glyceraldehyde 3-phosphate dehydrogenase
MLRVAINGLGRIGRAAFKIILDTPGMQLIAINDLVPAENLAYLLNYDTVYGKYEKRVHAGANLLRIEDQSFKLFNEKDPADLPWDSLNIDTVFECTGVFTEREGLIKHIKAGARRVILSAPTKSEDVMTVVHGVNKAENGDNQVISCASCTTNCITPVVEVMGRRIGIKKAIMTTMHAFTASQALVDSPHKKLRRGRSGAANFVPTSTGAAIATTKVLPEYKDKFDGVAVRGPIPVGSIADLVFVTERKTSVEEINKIFIDESESEKYKGILDATDDPIVSSDIIKNNHASIVDLGMTKVVDGDLVKIMSWYDNEWGYASQMIREAL